MENNTLVNEAKAVLSKLSQIIANMPHDDFKKPLEVLNNSTIGEHSRHIIELFQCLLSGYEFDLVNYDERKRDTKIQTEKDYALACISNVIETIYVDNKTLKLNSSYKENSESIDTNYYRELLYNIEHCIHHQAIIRIGLNSLNCACSDQEFGIAKSTLNYKSNVYS